MAGCGAAAEETVSTSKSHREEMTQGDFAHIFLFLRRVVLVVSVIPNLTELGILLHLSHWLFIEVCPTCHKRSVDLGHV